MQVPSAPCTICGTMADQRCGECLAAHYCSMKCQIADRPLHRLFCSVYRPFLATRPKRRVVRVEQTDYIFDYKLALLFPFEAEEPELIWVEVQVDIDDPEKDWEGHMLDRLSNPSSEMHEIPLPNEEGIALEFNLDKYVPRDTHPESMVVTWEHLFAKNRNLQDFWPFDENESEVGNQCLEKLNEGYSFTGHCSSRYPPKDHGNQVVMRCKRVSDYSRKEGKCYHDVTLTDLQLAFNHFSRHNNTFEGAKPNEFYIRQNTDWVKVVKLSSHYERFFEKKETYEEIEVTKGHDIFSKFEVTCSIAKHLGFPLRIMKGELYNWTPDQFQEKYRGYLTSHALTMEQCALVVEGEMESLHWGGRDEEKWETHTDQPFLVARADKEDVTAPQVEALYRYYIEDLCHEFRRHWMEEQAQRSIYDFEPSDELRPSRSCREKFTNEFLPSRRFEDRFEKVKQKKLAEGDLSWKDAAPPKPSIAALPDVHEQVTPSHKRVKGRKEAIARKATDSQKRAKSAKKTEIPKKQGQKEVSKLIQSTKRKRDN